MRLFMLEMLETVGNIMSPEELIALEKLFEKLTSDKNQTKTWEEMNFSID